MPPRHKPSKVAKFFEDFQTALNPARLFQRKARPAKPRSVYINQALPAELFDKKGKVPKAALYTSSQVVTSKYTVITFLPRNLLEQVRRPPPSLGGGAASASFGPGRPTLLLLSRGRGCLGRPPAGDSHGLTSLLPSSVFASSAGSQTSSSLVRTSPWH